MSILNSLKTWSLGGVSFARVLTGDSDPRWFARAAQTAIDVVLYGAQRYVDIGGVDTETLTIQAATEVSADRDALVSLLGQRVTVVSAGGQTATVVVTKAQAVANDGTPVLQANLELTLVSQ